MKTLARLIWWISSAALIVAVGCAPPPTREDSALSQSPAPVSPLEASRAATIKRCEDLGGVAVLDYWAVRMDRCDFPCAAKPAERTESPR